jgi:hypothetical protein
MLFCGFVTRIKLKQCINLKFLAKLKKKKKKTPTIEEATDVLEDTQFIENEKGGMGKLQVKAMMIIFFDIRGIIMIEKEPEDQTLNHLQVNYLEVLTTLSMSEEEKARTVEKDQDNAPALNTTAIIQFLADKCIFI